MPFFQMRPWVTLDKFLYRKLAILNLIDVRLDKVLFRKHSILNLFTGRLRLYNIIDVLIPIGYSTKRM